ncbi:CDP-glycerol glycerophosphotransferase family protein [Glaciihabitans sp. dw_435]|uniref:CDP-glycerol glycerophosphotransferase family protein n=1 Tax=Glaciihabitans sp. dw_435 TaxID=2720081 RepID=UPI0027DDBD9C|nr:CDP-glycerol glycerophosphotransferase family protein [Glaciihabitans sp. dw_435]
MTGATDAETPRRTIRSLAIVGDDSPSLSISGDFTGTAPTVITLIGPRLRLTAPVVVTDTGFSADLPLLTSRWGGPALPPPSGDYVIEVPTADDTSAATTLAATLPDPRLYPALFRTEFSDHPLTLSLAAPLADDEVGPANQQRLEAEYRATNPTPLDAVFFESFYGQNVSCNPRGIDRALTIARPNTARYWSVVDASVEVPQGATALIEGSTEWWRIRGAVRLIVVNDWLRKRFRKRKFQTVLQTWHGTPLKKIGLDRKRVHPRTIVATLRERYRWNILLSQNPYSTRIFRTAYGFVAPVWQDGYPRNDALVTGDGGTMRATLGIAADATVVLYAPTWRDDRPGDADQLDVAAFTERLGDGYVTLLRGHSRSIAHGGDVHAANVIDVTSYPDVSDLFLAADALVTDYSSVMFDFTVTGKPIYFFTPDVQSYRDELRGFYFDMLPTAPGPVVETVDDLVAHITNPAGEEATYHARYQAWKKRYNPWDDGGAADRVVRRILDRGILD